MIPFPTLHRTDTMELPAVAAASFLLSAVVLPFSRTLGIIIVAPSVIIAVFCALVGLRNAFNRLRWSMSLDSRLSARRALKQIQESPQRFVLHIQYYSGGFDRNHLAPAAVVEDLSSGQHYAVFPASWKIVTAFEQPNARIVDAEGQDLNDRFSAS